MLRKKASHIVAIILVLGLVSFHVHAEESMDTFDPEEDTGFFYTIKKGDTLWDLSQKFYSSEWDWPGLWQMNKEIPNPHWIYPGKVIRVYLKDHLKKEKQPEIGAPIVVEPTIVPRFSYPSIDMVSFIKEAAITPLGKIIKEEANNIMITTDDLIFIEPMGSGSLIPGTRYHIYETETVTHEPSGFTGVKHLIKGSIEVIEHKTTYVTARVIKSVRTIREDDFIMPYTERDPVLTVLENPPALNGVLLCSEDNDIMINDGFVGFISKGSNQNVRPGQIYTVLKDNVRSQSLGTPWYEKKKNIALAPLEAGRVIVLHAEPTAATVLVINSRFDIPEGSTVN